MLKSKMMFGLIATVMVLALAQSGYAQMTISATGNPSPRETATNHTAETNDPTIGNGMIITGTLLSDAYVTGGRLRITYPARVTNSTTFPPEDFIRLTTATGIFTGATVATLDNANGRVEITLPCGTTNQGAPVHFPVNVDTGTMILEGVRIDANAITTAPASATLSIQSISSTGTRHPTCTPGVAITPANVSVSTPSTEVISALSPGLGSVGNGGIPSSVSTSTSASTTQGSNFGAPTASNPDSDHCPGADAFHADCGVATVYTNRNAPDQLASFTIQEGHGTAWFNASTTQFAGAQGFTDDASLRLTFNGLPAGVTLTLAVAQWTSGTPVLSRSSITTGNNTSNVTFNSDLGTGSTGDRVTFRITGITVASGTSLSPGTVSVTATMIPIGEALNDTDSAITSPFPRFAEAQVGTATIVNIVPANTTLLIPFAVAAGAYDTGIALANTSADPFGTVNGGATPQAGTVRLDLYPSNATGAATSANFTTSATKKPGLGIAADGSVAPGATWTVLLSELLPQAGLTGSFTGYIFVQANFLYAHGAAYVFDGRGFTSATPVLVMAPPAIVGRTGIGSATAETLAF